MWWYTVPSSFSLPTLSYKAREFSYLPIILFHNHFKGRRQPAFLFFFFFFFFPFSWKRSWELAETGLASVGLEDASKSIRSCIVNAWHGLFSLSFHSLCGVCVCVHLQLWWFSTSKGLRSSKLDVIKQQQYKLYSGLLCTWIFSFALLTNAPLALCSAFIKHPAPGVFQSLLTWTPYDCNPEFGAHKGIPCCC